MHTSQTQNLWLWPKCLPLAFSVAKMSLAEMSGLKRPKPKCPWPKCPSTGEGSIPIGLNLSALSPEFGMIVSWVHTYSDLSLGDSMILRQTRFSSRPCRFLTMVNSLTGWGSTPIALNLSTQYQVQKLPIFLNF